MLQQYLLPFKHRLPFISTLQNISGYLNKHSLCDSKAIEYYSLKN